MDKELKTLKDLPNVAYDNTVDAIELRKEAIKWYKHLEKVTSEHDVWDFIQTFFNLTDEELSEVQDG